MGLAVQHGRAPPLADRDGHTAPLPLVLRIDTADEVRYFENGGILSCVLRNLLAA